MAIACCRRMLVALVLAAPGVVLAQAGPEIPQPSPKARVEQRVGLTDLSLDYSSPAVKGRKIWGGLVPHDQLWRAGANMATKLTVSRDFNIGGVPVKAGAYALYITPGKAAWTVHLNTNAQTGGTTGYDAKNDIAKFSIKPTTLAASRERLLYVFTDMSEDSASLDLEWEKVRLRIPISLDTRAQVQASIEKTLGEVWRPHFVSARWLLDSGGDLDRAVGFIDKSIAIQPTWSNEWMRAQIMAKKGNKAEAIASATRAQTLGQGDPGYESNGKADIAKALSGWK